MAQLKTKGKITDPTPRGCFDLNDYTIIGNVVHMNLYNRKEECVAVTKFDEQFLPLLQGRKWRPVWKTCKYYAETIGSPSSGLSHEYMHRVIAKAAGILRDGYEIDHIDGDALNNCLSNLRIASTQDQKLNLGPRSNGKIPVRGVSYSNKEKKYHVDFVARKHRYYVKRFDTLEEAVYARYVLEREITPEWSLTR